MLLKKFSCTYGPTFGPYSETRLVFEEISFQNLNLIVGKNASGKSLLAQFINYLAKRKQPNNSFTWSFTYEDEGNLIKYTVEIPDAGLIKEILTHNQESLINRSGGKAEIFSFITKSPEIISPPTNEFVIHTRRDAKAYPYIEDIIEWQEGVHFFRFGNIHPNSFLGHSDEDSFLTSIPDFQKIFEVFTEKDFDVIAINANKIGFKVNRFYTVKSGEKNVLYMDEQGVPIPLSQYSFSQGMFRAISLLIFIHYLTEKVGAGVILVDDLCEGMDYERASKLGKLIYEALESKNIQFIATSNDSFLMNVVDVKYWNILHREGNHIQSYNITNSKEKFDKFKKSGLNNFDLFSSDFLEKV